ncbi:hypothetical protein MNBD_GAMMA23-2423 [hydrothermal vent metagenome]|uniref:Uncharacterized protein n=1 Tax=hydrothermal vent metagenome TaxID=652676 RepID=A0A3B0ZTP7_9ZZZZ
MGTGYLKKGLKVVFAISLLVALAIGSSGCGTPRGGGHGGYDNGHGNANSH